MKKKLGNILMILGGICLVVGFITFALGGFISANSDSFGLSGGVVVGFILFFIGMVLMTIGVFIKNSDTLKQFSELSNISIEKFELPRTNIQTKCEYCGSIYAKNSSKCPSCGAKKK